MRVKKWGEEAERVREELACHLDSMHVLGMVGAEEDSEALFQFSRWWSLSKTPETRGGIHLQMFNECVFMLVHKVPENIQEEWSGRRLETEDHHQDGGTDVELGVISRWRHSTAVK